MPQQPQQQSFAAKVFAQLVTLVGTLLGYLVALVMPKPVVPKPTAVRLTAPTKGNPLSPPPPHSSSLGCLCCFSYSLSKLVLLPVF